MLKLLLLIAALALVTGIAPAADHIIGPTVSKTYTFSKHMDDLPIVLPALYEVCKSIGIAHDDCVKDPKYGAMTAEIQVKSLDLTDQNLWFGGIGGSTEGPNSMGADCYKPIPVGHYYTYDGALGTDYLCHVKPENDAIDATQLKALFQVIADLNAKSGKTLREHLRAMELKHILAWYAGGMVE